MSVEPSMHRSADERHSNQHWSGGVADALRLPARRDLRPTSRSSRTLPHSIPPVANIQQKLTHEARARLDGGGEGYSCHAWPQSFDIGPRILRASKYPSTANTPVPRQYQYLQDTPGAPQRALTALELQREKVSKIHDGYIGHAKGPDRTTGIADTSEEQCKKLYDTRAAW